MCYCPNLPLYTRPQVIHRNTVTIYTIIVVIMLQLKKTVKDGLEAALGKYDNTSSVEKDQIDYLQSEVCTCMLNFFQLGHTIISLLII